MGTYQNTETEYFDVTSICFLRHMENASQHVEFEGILSSGKPTKIQIKLGTVPKFTNFLQEVKKYQRSLTIDTSGGAIYTPDVPSPVSSPSFQGVDGPIQEEFPDLEPA